MERECRPGKKSHGAAEIPKGGVREQTDRRRKACRARSAERTFGHTERTLGDIWVEMPSAVQH